MTEYFEINKFMYNNKRNKPNVSAIRMEGNKLIVYQVNITTNGTQNK